MKNTLVSFINKYYKYRGDVDSSKQGLTIGGFKSAWLADLVTALILKTTETLFSNFIYHRIYQDDGFIIMKWKQMKKANEQMVSFFSKLGKQNSGIILSNLHSRNIGQRRWQDDN